MHYITDVEEYMSFMVVYSLMICRSQYVSGPARTVESSTTGAEYVDSPALGMLLLCGRGFENRCDMV